MTVTGPVPALAVDGLSKQYGAQSVLADLTLAVPPGEIFGLIGLNGVGKTTLIKLALDLARPDQGTVRFFGHDNRDAGSREAVSYLPEVFQPPRLLTGWEFLSLTLAYFGQKVDPDGAALVANGLALDPALLANRIGTYSKGTAQKIGLLAALLPERPLLILDEPMSGLDPEARAALKVRLLSETENGRTVFFSSHVLSDVEEICDRIGVLHDGGMAFVGPVAGFRARHPEASLERAFLSAIGRL